MSGLEPGGSSKLQAGSREEEEEEVVEVEEEDEEEDPAPVPKRFLGRKDSVTYNKKTMRHGVPDHDADKGGTRARDGRVRVCSIQ